MFICIGVFNLINGSKPLTKEILEKLLKRIYPDDSQVGKLHSAFTENNQGICFLILTIMILLTCVTVGTSDWKETSNFEEMGRQLGHQKSHT